MATASVTHSFTPNTDILSSQVNTNFNDLVTFLNGSTIHKDGSVAATGHLSGPATDPVSANQYTRKAYVDLHGVVAQLAQTTNETLTASGNSTLVLNNVSVVAGRTYEIHFKSELSLTSAGAWVVELYINGAAYDRLAVPRSTSADVFDASAWWTAPTTQATDDFLIHADKTSGGDLVFTGTATRRKTLTIIDHGVI